MTRLSNGQFGPRDEFVRICQRLNFGRIENLHVRNGEPVFDPPPSTTEERKFAAAENGPRTEGSLHPPRLKQQMVEMFALFDQLKNGSISVIEVKHGLPFRAFLKGGAAA